MQLKKTLAALLLAAGSALGLAHADPLSYARYDQVRTSDLHLDLKADFASHTLAGYAELTLNWLDKSARTLVLDTSELNIARVQLLQPSGRWQAASYMLDKPDAEKGRALRIAVPFQPQKVRIYYRTAPSATALQWMAPQQTMSGKRPFMFSQSESINARSWVPLQDTPAVRFTYSARIAAPEGLRVVMSASNDQQSHGAGGWKFSMAQPIPSYLLAIAIGEIEVRNLGPRSAVYAEPARIEAAAYEMADTEKMISAAEELYGPYRWERYDMLVLPPSFPIGGMENPRLTFVTPTMIAGDRSLVDLIAHELAHSWSGNLVTNATWKHFWLNEGFTNYVTTRVVEKLYGAEVAQMNLQVEQEEAMASLPSIPPAKQALVTRDADTASSTYTDTELVYPKGAWLLRTLEQRAGRSVFDAFLRGWFDQHAFQSVRTEEFVSYLKQNLLAAHPEVMSAAELDEWLYGSGIPASARHEASPRLAALDAQRSAWLQGTLATADLPAQGWIALEWMHFLNDIDGKATASQLQELDQRFALASSSNNEIAYRFYLSSIKAGYNVRAPLQAFLLSVGRQKFVVPLYTALLKNPAEREWARTLYVQARPHYHPVTQSAVDKQFKKP
ncbi:M1 family metallopeptidase [Duganella qianjiadongensis]|uniref:Aminopeptidase N n=1 Tax=Duganella qianjiadongensis TaxID=2692176 RepID=A0ABW9VPS4_9BURK|nr:M1 family metallopeptidase [Duganella qianjiadongensis]MYM41563.1 aminopeptidase [Duganella qianjiadongensis]